MLSLKQFRDRAKGAADLYNYAALVDEGLVLCKDGSLLAGFFYRGPDSQSATPAELNYLTRRLNAALAKLGAGFALWIDAVRLPTAGYPASLGLLLSGRGDARHRRGAPPAVSRRRRSFRNRVCAACKLHAAAQADPAPCRHRL